MVPVSEMGSQFLEKASGDPRIGPLHISLYTTLLVLWGKRENDKPLFLFSREVMPLCKIYGAATYNRCIRDLHQWGYIVYVASYNHFKGSKVQLVEGHQ
jgi:hypothetical protein